ncbi:MAG TPA: PorV/PorQ family protein [Rhodothermales bacterium]|nr:PorV/PorQ family protein [Rhodothermales bacterium]
MNKQSCVTVETLSLICALVVSATFTPRLAAAQVDDGSSQTITKVATSSAQFLKIGIGARAIGMGGSFVAATHDLSALYWNPAGLSAITGSAVQVAHTQYLADIDYSYAAFGTSFGTYGTVAVALTILDSGTMPVRTVNVPEGTGEVFDVQSFVAQLSYGKGLTDRFSIGGSAKFVRESIWHSSASTIAFDVGALFTTPYDRLRFGASISNFGSDMQMDGRDILFSEDPDQQNEGNVEIVNARYDMDSFPLPMIFRFGLSWDAVALGDHTIALSTDAAHPNDNSEYVNLGAEYDFRGLLALRAGFKHLFEEDGEQGLTLGGGLSFRMERALSVQIDYAYADFGRLEETHWFTLGMSF